MTVGELRKALSRYAEEAPVSLPGCGSGWIR